MSIEKSARDWHVVCHVLSKRTGIRFGGHEYVFESLPDLAAFVAEVSRSLADLLDPAEHAMHLAMSQQTAREEAAHRREAEEAFYADYAPPAPKESCGCEACDIEGWSTCRCKPSEPAPRVTPEDFETLHEVARQSKERVAQAKALTASLGLSPTSPPKGSVRAAIRGEGPTPMPDAIFSATGLHICMTDDEVEQQRIYAGWLPPEAVARVRELVEDAEEHATQVVVDRGSPSPGYFGNDERRMDDMDAAAEKARTALREALALLDGAK
jgi:hypothetical protein